MLSGEWRNADIIRCDQFNYKMQNGDLLNKGPIKRVIVVQYAHYRAFLSDGFGACEKSSLKSNNALDCNVGNK